MRNCIRNIISIMLVVLVVFTSIGLNIVSFNCDGCSHEHTKISMLDGGDELMCPCCHSNALCNECENSPKEHRHAGHQHAKSTYIQLLVDSPDIASVMLNKIIVPVVAIELIGIRYDFDSLFPLTSYFSSYNLARHLSGRELLANICVLRN